MTAERSKESIQREPDRRVEVHGSPTRCPYCHDDVRPEDATVCADCLARHHSECWSERGCCSSCSASRPLVPAAATTAESEREESPAPPTARLTLRGLAGERWQRLLELERSRRFPISTIGLLPVLVGLPLSFLLTWAYHDNISYLSSEEWTTAVVFSWGLFHALGFLIWTMGDPALEAEIRAEEAKRAGLDGGPASSGTSPDSKADPAPPGTKPPDDKEA